VDVGIMTLGDHLPNPHTGEYELDQAARHRTFVDQAVQAEQLGFNSIHLGEHHCSDYILSAPPVVLAAIAERTTTLRLSTGVTLATHLDPIRLAEDYATVDNLSGGRVEMIMGRGGFTLAFEVFGQSFDDSRPVYEESVRLVQKVLAEENVHYDAEFRPPLRGITVQPRPVQRPHPPIWIGAGSSEASFDLAAELGLHLMVPTIFGPAEGFLPMVDRYRERSGAAGHPVTARKIGTCSHTFVSKDSQDARAFWRPYYDNYLRWVGGILASQPGGPDLPPFEVEAQLAGPAMCGSPAQIIDGIGALREVMAMDLHVPMFDHGGLPQAELQKSIELFGTEVLPKIR
jgi:alkanesulfonate monooxygenase SsuD/methylene tetrahydromethanopterin reductase-like flavin-dependent oxidoreductase (luciferase family)